MFFGRYRLHHVGVIIPTLEEAGEHMSQFGLVEDYRGYVDRWSCWCIFTTPSSGPAIELVIPTGGPLAKFNRGMAGVHHYAFEIDSFDEVTRWCEEKDIKLLEPAPIRGAGNFLCNFIHPLSTRGIMIELVQPIG
jgi:methylmalonyl-CoA/ethylmalonyl-CoA epimerase